MAEEIIATKRSKQICPECHQSTLVLNVVLRPSEQNPLKLKRYQIAHCDKCGYSSPPREIDSNWLGG